LTTTVILGWMTTICWTKPNASSAKALMGLPDDCPLANRDDFLKRCADEITRRDPKGAETLLKGLV
jgi:hypothetical protein